jgi:hypothetical protein
MVLVFGGRRRGETALVGFATVVFWGLPPACCRKRIGSRAVQHAAESLASEPSSQSKPPRETQHTIARDPLAESLASPAPPAAPAPRFVSPQLRERRRIALYLRHSGLCPAQDDQVAREPEEEEEEEEENTALWGHARFRADAPARPERNRCARARVRARPSATSTRFPQAPKGIGRRVNIEKRATPPIPSFLKSAKRKRKGGPSGGRAHPGKEKKKKKKEKKLRQLLRRQPTPLEPWSDPRSGTLAPPAGRAALVRAHWAVE